MSVSRPLKNPLRHLDLTAYDLASYLAEKDVEDVRKILGKVIDDYKNSHYLSSFFYTLDGVDQLELIKGEINQENILEKLQEKFQQGVFEENSLNLALFRDLLSELKNINYDEKIISSKEMLLVFNGIFREEIAIVLEEQRLNKEKLKKEEALKNLLEKTIDMEFKFQQESYQNNLALTQLEDEISQSRINLIPIQPDDAFPVCPNNTEIEMEILQKRNDALNKLLEKFSAFQEQMQKKDEENNRNLRELREKQNKYEQEVLQLNDNIYKLTSELQKKRDPLPENDFYAIKESKNAIQEANDEVEYQLKPLPFKFTEPQSKDPEFLRKITDLSSTLKFRMPMFQSKPVKKEVNIEKVLNEEFEVIDMTKDVIRKGM